MPKFIGNDLSGAAKIEDNANAPAGCVKLSFSQAQKLPSSQILKSLDTTDKGSRTSLAKRWYRWFARAVDVMTCPNATPNMRAKAEAVLRCTAHEDCAAVPVLGAACAERAA